MDSVEFTFQLVCVRDGEKQEDIPFEHLTELAREIEHQLRKERPWEIPRLEVKSRPTAIPHARDCSIRVMSCFSVGTLSHSVVGSAMIGLCEFAVERCSEPIKIEKASMKFIRASSLAPAFGWQIRTPAS